MIYPGKRKVRIFKGGGMASLFDNPGTYLGIQYIPTAQETPDIEGLQYITQMEQAKAAQMAEKAQKNAIGSEEISKMFQDFKGLDGEQASAINIIQNRLAEWQTKYNTVPLMSSNEAAAEKSRIINDAARLTNMLLNSKEEYTKTYDQAKDVMGDFYTDGGNVFIVDPQKPEEGPKPVSIEEYFEKKDTDFKDRSPLKVNDLFSWRRSHRQLGMNDGLIVDQYSEKETRSYINDHFNKIGTDSRSVEGSGEFSSILSQVGLNPNNFSRDDLKVKVQTGELNLQRLADSFVKTMDPKVMRSLVASILSQGDNPYEKVQVEGMKEPVSKLNLRIHEILTGVKAGIDSSIEIEKDNSQVGGDNDFLTNTLGRPGTLAAIKGMDIVMASQIRPLETFNPYIGQKVTAQGMIIPNLAKEDMERLNGGPMQFGRIANDQEVYVNGKRVVIGSVTDATDGSLYFDTGNPLNVITFDVKGADGLDRVLNVMEKEILVNEEGLKSMGFTPNEVERGVQGVREIDDDELAALPGITKELTSSLEGWLWGNDGDNYLVRIQVPLSSLAGHGGKTQSKASAGQNAEFSTAMNRQIQQAENFQNNVSDAVRSMLSFSTK